jgi:hypothetical protein
MREYLTDRSINTSQAKAVFKYKTRMANFSDNFRPGEATKPCHATYKKVIFSKVAVETAGTLEHILKFRQEYVNQYMAKIFKETVSLEAQFAQWGSMSTLVRLRSLSILFSRLT